MAIVKSSLMLKVTQQLLNTPCRLPLLIHQTSPNPRSSQRMSNLSLKETNQSDKKSRCSRSEDDNDGTKETNVVGLKFCANNNVLERMRRKKFWHSGCLSYEKLFYYVGQ